MKLPSLLVLFASAWPLLAQTPTPSPASANATPPTTPSPAPQVPADPTIGPHPLVYEDTPQFCVDVLMVSIPQEKALPLIPQLRNPAKIEAAHATILEMIVRKEAHLIDWPEVTSHSGSRAVSETVLEQRFPSEFEQPQEPQTLGAPSKEPSPAEKAMRDLRNLGVIVPTAFETRNTGGTLEVEASVSSDFSAVSMQIVPQAVELLGMQNFSAGKNEKGEPLTVPQPLFRTHKVNCDLTLRSGERRLIYTGKPLQSEGSIVFFILGAKVIPPIASSPKAK
jgi:hypothetical protein